MLLEEQACTGVSRDNGADGTPGGASACIGILAVFESGGTDAMVSLRKGSGRTPASFLE